MSIARRVGLAGFAGGLGLIASATPGAAMEFTYHPPLILAVGHIKNGDENTFKRLLASIPKGEVKGVVLHSGGGFVHAAGEIGREIREKGLTTVVDASSVSCVSACTILFAAGTQRVYLNAGGVKDGATADARKGLGFHEGSSSTSRDPNHYSGAGTAQVIAFFYEFGVSGAAALATKAPPESVYMVSGPTALQIGLATRLGDTGGSAKKKGRP